MSDRTPPFFVKMADPARTFYDPTTGVYIAQDQVQEISVVSRTIRESLMAGGLVYCDPPQIQTGGLVNQETGVNTSTQIGAEGGTGASEGSEEETNTTEGEETQGNLPGQEEETQEEETQGEETQTGEETQDEDEEEKELSLSDITKLAKKTAGVFTKKKHTR